MTIENTPFEAGLGRFCKNFDAQGCIGGQALQREKLNGPKRQIRGIKIAGKAVPPCSAPWPIFAAGTPAGQITSAAWSPDLNTNVAIAMVERAYWEAGTQLSVQTPHGLADGTVSKLPFH
jgi:dimethylsulfoniopropionate demethylase